MKYRATIIMPMGRMSEDFPTVKKAEEWLDSLNNNWERTTMIDEIDDKGKVVDGFIYTRAAP